MSFYVVGELSLRKGKVADTEWLPVDAAPRGNAPTCPVCSSYVGPRPLLPVVDIELKCWGRLWGDIAFGVGDELLITERTQKIAECAGLKGFEEFLPTRLVRATARSRGMSAPPTYVAAKLARGGGIVDENRSGFVRQGPRICSYCRTAGVLERYDGIYLEEGSYGKFDIFYPWGLPGTIMVSQRLKDIFTANAVTNFYPMTAEKCGRDYNSRQ
jgi:hypothetical protein